MTDEELKQLWLAKNKPTVCKPYDMRDNKFSKLLAEQVAMRMDGKRIGGRVNNVQARNHAYEGDKSLNRFHQRKRETVGHSKTGVIVGEGL